MNSHTPYTAERIQPVPSTYIKNYFLLITFSNSMHGICRQFVTHFVSWNVHYMRLHCRNNSSSEAVGLHRNK